MGRAAEGQEGGLVQVCLREQTGVALGVAGCWDGHCCSLQKREAGGMLGVVATPARASPCPTEGLGVSSDPHCGPGALLQDPRPVIRLREKAPTLPVRKAGRAGPGDGALERASPPTRRSGGEHGCTRRWL